MMAGLMQVWHSPRADTGKNDSVRRAARDDEEQCARRLLAAIARGEESAMAELFRVYSRRIHAYVLTQCRDPLEAEEVVIDTLHEVWRNPLRFRGESRFSTWLIGIARFKMLDAIRARNPVAEDIDDFGDMLADDTSDTFEHVAAQERSEVVHRCVENLPDPYRECIHLVFFEGCSLAEVARIQAIPVNTVKTRLFNARRRLAGKLAAFVAADGGQSSPGH